MAEEVGSFCGDAVEAVADVNGLYIGNDLILIFQLHPSYSYSTFCCNLQDVILKRSSYKRREE